MKITVEGQVMKIREYLKKDKTTGVQADVYVDGVRPTLVNSGMDVSVEEVKKFIGKVALIDFEVSKYDGRDMYIMTGIRFSGGSKP